MMDEVLVKDTSLPSSAGCTHTGCGDRLADDRRRRKPGRWIPRLAIQDCDGLGMIVALLTLRPKGLFGIQHRREV
jgi:hypothetical protein